MVTHLHASVTCSAPSHRPPMTTCCQLHTYTKLRTNLSEFENFVRKMSAISSASNVLINYTLHHIYRRYHLAIYTPWKIDPRNDQIYTPEINPHLWLRIKLPWSEMVRFTKIYSPCQNWEAVGSASSDSLQWRHNGHDSVSNHQLPECLLSRLIRRRSKKTSKLRVTGLCAGNSPETGEFPAQRASNAENVSIWWRHHVTGQGYSIPFVNLYVWDIPVEVI